MADVVIRIENLFKEYRLGLLNYGTLRQDLQSWWARVRGKEDPNSLVSAHHSKQGGQGHILALNDISLEVRQGEIVGIIGRNGAGKSTLLKILSRVTAPTRGCVNLKGRVGSLLEVGTGFHPELTGRENIFLNGAILGMTRSEVWRKFDEIVAFAEIEKFIDTPVKRYSSGMYVRLAFAVAAHLEPEILLVDEVLAVGDAQFQKKCIGKMGEVAKEGRTILFVSHNMGAITRLCSRVVWIDGGCCVLDGAAEDVVTRYQSKFLNVCSEWVKPAGSKAGAECALLRVSASNAEGSQATLYAGNETICIRIEYVVTRNITGCQIGARLHNSEGQAIFTTADSDVSGMSALPREPGRYTSLFTIPGHYLVPGTYYLLVAAHLPQRNIYEMVEQTVVFEVSPSGSLAALDGRIGVVTPLIHWETIKEGIC